MNKLKISNSGRTVYIYYPKGLNSIVWFQLEYDELFHLYLGEKYGKVVDTKIIGVDLI